MPCVRLCVEQEMCIDGSSTHPQLLHLSPPETPLRAERVVRGLLGVTLCLRFSCVGAVEPTPLKTCTRGDFLGDPRPDRAKRLGGHLFWRPICPSRRSNPMVLVLLLGALGAAAPARRLYHECATRTTRAPMTPRRARQARRAASNVVTDVCPERLGLCVWRGRVCEGVY